jgi:hypothetical protein
MDEEMAWLVGVFLADLSIAHHHGYAFRLSG